jgi:hypothetical protein
LLLEKKPCYPLNRRLGGSQSHSEQFGEEKIFCPCSDLNPRLSSPWPGKHTTYAILIPHSFIKTHLDIFSSTPWSSGGFVTSLTLPEIFYAFITGLGNNV